MLKKCFLIICVLLTCISSPPAGLAAKGPEDVLHPLYQHIKSVDASLTIDGSTMRAVGRGAAQSSNTCTQLKLVLQRQRNNSSVWNAVCIWTASANGQDYATIIKSVIAEAGCKYRAMVVCSITTTEGVVLETSRVYSDVVSYR